MGAIFGAGVALAFYPLQAWFIFPLMIISGAFGGAIWAMIPAMGIGFSPVKFGISFTLTHLNQAGALVHVYLDGSIYLNHGGTEMGQGLFVKMAQVADLKF